MIVNDKLQFTLDKPQRIETEQERRTRILASGNAVVTRVYTKAESAAREAARQAGRKARRGTKAHPKQTMIDCGQNVPGACDAYAKEIVAPVDPAIAALNAKLDALAPRPVAPAPDRGPIGHAWTAPDLEGPRG
jgi:hypothetical protein